ncbi:MAG TPA: MASE3 domain-containing protein, partial [Desulfosarcina sp.]|nr:MASE3 domain-containing protein [Desulfosarcina sp.]
GLTPFKKISEYVIAAILLIGLFILHRRRGQFEGKVLRLLAASMLLTIASEWLFTVYISVYGISNLVGHVFKLSSFWLIYQAIIATGLREPYALLFRDLAQSEKRYRDLVDRLPTGICEIDPDQRIRYVNPAGIDLIGYTENDLRNGLDIKTLLEPDDLKRARQRMVELSRGQTIDSRHFRVRRKDGTVAEVIVSSTPVFRDGELQSIQTSLTDVTELNRLQNRLQEARRMEAVAMLAGGMAHEINNVLMGVVGGIEVLKLSAADGKAADNDFAAVIRGCDRIAGLIKRLLAYSRGGRYRSEAIDLTQFIRHRLPGIESHLGPDVRLSFEASDQLPTVTADPTQLEMVVAEIVDNAVEALEGAGRIAADLEVRDIDDDEAGKRPGMKPGRYVRLRVRDTGKGMNAETLQQIFVPFYSEHLPGRGMGMAAVYGIVKNHGGWIGVDSELGHGTTVSVYLPVTRSDAQVPAKDEVAGKLHKARSH